MTKANTNRVAVITGAGSGIGKACALTLLKNGWSVVLAAKHQDSQQAMETLCRAYWYPLYAYARRCGVSPADSEDLVQGFFASFLQNKGFCRVDAAQGRLRSYLLASFRYFQSTESRSAAALKRGGAIRFESLEIPSDDAERRYCQEPVEVMAFHISR